MEEDLQEQETACNSLHPRSRLQFIPTRPLTPPDRGPLTRERGKCIFSVDVALIWSVAPNVRSIDEDHQVESLSDAPTKKRSHSLRHAIRKRTERGAYQHSPADLKEYPKHCHTHTHTHRVYGVSVCAHPVGDKQRGRICRLRNENENVKRHILCTKNP